MIVDYDAITTPWDRMNDPMNDGNPTNHPAADFLAGWPRARRWLTDRIAARAVHDPLFPRRYAELQLELVDGALKQLQTLLRWLDVA